MLRNSNMLRSAYNVTKATCRAITVESHGAAKMFLERAAAASSVLDTSVVHRKSYPSLNLSPTNIVSTPSAAGGLLSPISKKLEASNLFEYRVWADEDVNEVVDFIVNNFIRREVLMGAHSASEANARSYIEYCIEEAHHQGASFLARDTRTNTIKGVRVNGIGSRNGLELLQDFGPAMNSVAKFMHTAERSLESVTGYQEFMRHVIICVSPEVLKSGVATRLNQLCRQFASENNLGLLTATCTSIVPEKLALKCGFRLHAKICYDKYARDHRHLMDTRTFQIYQKLHALHGYARVMVKDVV